MLHSDWLVQTERKRLQIEFRPRNAKSDEFFKISTDCLFRLDPRTFRNAFCCCCWKTCQEIEHSDWLLQFWGVLIRLRDHVTHGYLDRIAPPQIATINHL